MLAVAKCGGPQTEFQPGRKDVTSADPPHRLPDPTETVHQNVSGRVYAMSEGSQALLGATYHLQVGCIAIRLNT